MVNISEPLIFVCYVLGLFDLVLLFSSTQNSKYYCSDTLRVYIILHVVVLFIKFLIDGMELQLQLINSQNLVDDFSCDNLNLFFMMMNIILWFICLFVIFTNSKCSTTLYYRLGISILSLLPLQGVIKFYFYSYRFRRSDAIV